MAEIQIFGRDDNATRLLKSINELAKSLGVQFKTLKQTMSEMDNQGRQTAAALRGIDEAGRKLDITITGLTGKKDKYRIKTIESAAATKDETAALKAQEEVTKRLAQAEKQRNESRKILRTVQRGFSQKELLGRGARPQEIFNLKKAEASLADFVANNNVSAKTVTRIWRDVAANSFKAYRNELGKVQAKVFNLVKAQRAVGQSAAQEMKRAQTATQTATKATKELLLSWQSIKRILVTRILSRVFFALTAQIRQAVIQAKEFSKAVAEIRTISQNAQLTTEEWERGLTRLSNAFGLDVLDIAEAAYQTLSNQVAEGTETFKFLEEAIRFGITTQTSATDSVQLLTAAINAYSLTIEDTESIAASFFKTIELGRIRGSELANTFGRVAILGNTLGISLNELQATLTTLTRRGIRTSEAMTQIRGLFLKLIKPTTEMKKLFKDIGIESGEAAIKAFGLSGFLQILQARTAGSTTELAKFVSRIRGLIAAIGLTGKGFESYIQDLEQIRDAQDTYITASELAFKNLGRQADITFQEIVNTIRKDFGKPLLELLTKINKEFISFSVIIKSLSAGILYFAGAIIILKAVKSLELLKNVLITSTLASKGFLGSLGSISKGIAANASIFIGLATVIGLVGKSLLDDYVKSWEKAQEANNQFFIDLEKAAERTSQNSVKYFDKLAETIKSTFATIAANIAKRVAGISDEIAAQVDVVEESAKLFERAYKDALTAIKDEIKGVDNAIKNMSKDIEKLDKFAKSFRLTVEEKIFQRDLELAPNVDDQFSLIETRIAKLRQRLNEAFKIGNVDLLQELSREILKLHSETDSLDREVLGKQKDLIEGLRDARQKAAEELASIVRQLTVAKQKNDLQDIEDLKRDRLGVIRELQTTERDLNKEIAKYQSDRLGEYSKKYKTTLETLVKETEKSVIELQVKLQAEALRLEKEKQAKQLEFDRLRDRIAQAREDRPDDELFKKDAEEINRLFSIRTKTIEETIVQLLKAGQIQESVLLSQQLVDEETLVVLNLKKKAEIAFITELKEEFEIIKRSLELQKQQTLEAEKPLKAARKRVATLIREKDIGGQIEKARKAGFWSPAAVSGTERPRFELLRKQFTEQSKLFIDAKTNGEDLAAVFRLLRTEYSEVFDEKATNQLKVLENTLIKFGTESKSLSGLFDKQQKVEAEFIKLDTALKTFGIIAVQTNEVVISSMDELLEKLDEVFKKFGQFKGLKVEIKTVTADVKGEARGGFLSSTDTIPSLLSPGEFVVNAKSARKFYSQLHGLNSGFARGGNVSTTNIGDLHIHGFQPSGNNSVDVVRLGKQLRREIRRGTVRLT